MKSATATMLNKTGLTKRSRAPKKRNPPKYRNVKVVTPDGRFDSKAEFRRWGMLKQLEKAGKIQQLERQVRFPLFAPGYGKANEKLLGKEWKVGDYIADFTYANDKGLVVEDLKGVRTDLFKWKARHFKVQYGFSITEVRA